MVDLYVKSGTYLERKKERKKNKIAKVTMSKQMKNRDRAKGKRWHIVRMIERQDCERKQLSEA